MPATQQADIVFGPFQEGSYEELGGASPRAINVVIDPKGVVSKRPGIAVYPVAPSGVVDADGITGLYSDNTGQLFAVGGTPDARRIYKLLNGAAANLSVSPNSTLRGRRRPTFAETEVFLIVAGGSNIQKVNLRTLISSQLGGNPPVASHVVANASRLAANDIIVDKTKVRFSGISQGTVDTSGHEQWDNTGLTEDGGFFTAEARPDPVQAVHENTNEVFVWGVDNVQIFQPDGDSGFSPSVTRESGTIAPYSIIKQGQDFFWLDQHRRIVYSDGRSFQNLEGPIKAQLDALSTPSDCFGYRVFTGHVDCLVWTFPTDGRTFAYQVGGGWSEWFGWDEPQSNFKRFIVNAHYLRRDGGLNIVGTTDGRIGRLSLLSYDDRGEKIVSYVESGFQNHETDFLKKCHGLKISLRRGRNTVVEATPPTEAFRTYGWVPIDEDLGMGVGNPGPDHLGMPNPDQPQNALVIHASVDSGSVIDTLDMFSEVTHVRLQWFQTQPVSFVRYKLNSVVQVPGDVDYFQLDVTPLSSEFNGTEEIPFPSPGTEGDGAIVMFLETVQSDPPPLAAPLCKIEYRDDTGPWNGPLYIDAGFIGDDHCVREIRSLGNYRRRQWRFTFSDTANLSLLKVTEVFSILGT